VKFAIARKRSTLIKTTKSYRAREAEPVKDEERISAPCMRGGLPSCEVRLPFMFPVIVTEAQRRGPEVEKWVGHGSSQDPVVENDWSLLPFFALADGAHA